MQFFMEAYWNLLKQHHGLKMLRIVVNNIILIKKSGNFSSAFAAV